MRWFTCVLILCSTVQICFGTIIHIPANQPTIQAGVDAAGAGDTILVSSGTYHESVDLDKAVALIGEDWNTANIVQVFNGGPAIGIVANGTMVFGFSITGTCWIGSDSNTVEHCRIGGTDGTAINLNGDYNVIKDNFLVNNGQYGIFTHTDVLSGNVIVGNTIASNGLDGIYLRNGLGGTADNLIYHNNFVDNNRWNARGCCADNVWNHPELQEGNYWSDFDEPGEGAYDTDSDGIVDSPYDLEGGACQDLYPMITGYATPLYLDANGPYTIYVNDVVHFEGLAVGGVPPYSWNWDFGDGMHSTEQSPSHLYETAGLYSIVTLTVTDSEDTQYCDTTTVTVVHAPHSVVWVDDDYSEETPGWGLDHFDVIQDAVSVSGDTGTVHVSNGSYVGESLILRPITMLGESSSGTLISGTILIGCSHVTVSGFGFKDYGLSIRAFEPAGDVVISNNRIGDCPIGVRLDSFGSGSIVTGNIIQNCEEAGLKIEYSSANTISNNVFISNEIGVLLAEFPYDNVIYHNSFIDNSTHNAVEYLFFGGNIWDSGYPAGGNYWSDFDEESEGAYDLFSGENQDIPGSDGIADSSYQVLSYVPPGYSLDRYPLMEPLISIQCGDANYDGAVDVDDAVYLVSNIFAGGPEPTPYESGDADCSGGIDIDDVVWVIAYIFSGGYAPCDTDGDAVPDC